MLCLAGVMDVDFAGLCFLGHLWVSFGFRCLTPRELSGDAVESEDLSGGAGHRTVSVL